MEELKEALGTAADATVLRKLSELEYRTSYSHRGRFYTLDELARLDAMGLWSFRQVWFSRFGTLVSTVEALVVAAEAGYDAAEVKARAPRGGQSGTGRPCPLGAPRPAGVPGPVRR